MKWIFKKKYLLVVKWRVLQHGVVGVRSDCAKGKHVLFLDVDSVNPWWLVKRLRYIQKKYKMGHMYIIRSSEHSYHVIELTSRTFGEVVDIQRDFDKWMTKRYLLFAIARGYWVLRCTRKKNAPAPKLACVLLSDEKNPQCKSHGKYLEKHFGVEIKNLQGTLHKVAYDKYPTVADKEVVE